MKATLMTLVALASTAHSWEDCDKSPIASRGPFSTNLAKTYSYRGHPIYVQYPNATLPQGAAGWPVVIFMHGMTLSWEYYAAHVDIWASHGFVVAVPFVKSAKKDDAVVPVTETDATSIYAAHGLLQGLANGTVPAPKDLQGAIDAQKLGLAGHSMGAEDTIRAAAGVRLPKGYAPLPAGIMKVAVSQHPSLCKFPPPYPITINKAEINNASLNGALLLFTSENDRAFLPGTPTAELKCWQAATGSSIFVNFKGSVCASYPPCKDLVGAPGCGLKRAFAGVGHLCACDAPGVNTWTSPELKWVTAAMRLYLHHGNSSSTACSALVWGDGTDSLKHDPNAANVVAHGPQTSSPSSAIVV